MKKNIDIEKWKGIRNSDTGEIDSGYLYIKKDEGILRGISIRAKNRSEAIKKYRANPDNPNNYNYINKQ